MDDARGIALVGFMGSGKSTVGRALADRLGWDHVDVDDVLARRFGPIPDQFARDGEAVFRQRERDVVAALSGPRTVLSTGGGTPVDVANRGILESRFQTVHLDVDLQTCRERVGDGDGRPVWADADARFADRRAVYATARATADGRGDVQGVVQHILDARGPRREVVEHGSGAYDVLMAPGLEGLSDRMPADVRVVTDTTVDHLWGARLAQITGRPADVVLDPGEPSKTLEVWGRAVDRLLTAGIHRTTSVVAFGGGVVGDLAGFAASALLRGVPLVQVPTTLLAMVDSSVGGKTGVNHPRGKNLIGAFHAPALVWMPLEVLGTLPARERIAGLGEVLKTAAVLDPLLLDVLEAHATALRDGDPGLTEHVVARSVRAKATVVAADEREAGVRRLLNAGHTVGHAIERAASYGSVLHGEAVAMGLVAEARWAAGQGLCDAGLSERIARVAGALGLPTEVPRDLDRETIRDALAVDKKVARDILWVPISVRAGVGACVPLPRGRAHELLPEPE